MQLSAWRSVKRVSTTLRQCKMIAMKTASASTSPSLRVRRFKRLICKTLTLTVLALAKPTARSANRLLESARWEVPLRILSISLTAWSPPSRKLTSRDSWRKSSTSTNKTFSWKNKQFLTIRNRSAQVVDTSLRGSGSPTFTIWTILPWRAPEKMSCHFPRVREPRLLKKINSESFRHSLKSSFLLIPSCVTRPKFKIQSKRRSTPIPIDLKSPRSRSSRFKVRIGATMFNSKP